MPTPIPFGPEFLVNTTTNSDQYGPAITALANGRFVVTFTDTSGNAPDLNSLCTRAQIFNADGSPFGTEFVVNTTRDGSQYEPAITALAGGGFAVAFYDLSQVFGANGADIRVQVFGPDGTKSGPEFIAPATPSGHQSEPAITALAHGRYVVVWTDSSGTGADTSGDAIRAQVFGAGGTRIGPQVLVNSTTAGHQNEPAVTALTNGNYVVSWTSHGADAVGQPVKSVNTQLFRPNGTAIGGEYVGNSTAGNFVGQFEPGIAGLTGGRYVVTWTNVNLFDTNIQGQIFNANGTAHGAVFTVNTTTANAQNDSTVTGLADGGFVVAWVDSTAGSPEIRAQAFRAGGIPNGAEFLVNADTTGLQRAPTVTGLADGRFVVAWEDLSGGPGDTTFAIRAQIFDARSAAITLIGTKDSDSFVGTSFNDTMAGAGGADGLTGGAGADVFVFRTAAEARLDHITDFTPLSDKLNFAAFMAGGHFIGSAGFVAGDGPQVRYDTGILRGDVTGDGVADFTLTLDGAPVLTAADVAF